MQAKTRATLQQFVQRAVLLSESSYLVPDMLMNIVQVIPNSLDPRGREQSESFVMRLRFFIQDNEATSLRNIAKALRDDATVDADLAHEFNMVRTEIAELIARKPPIAITSDADPHPATWGEILETFIYGDLAHLNVSRRKRFDIWAQHPASFALFSHQLNQVLVAFAMAIKHLANAVQAQLISEIELPPAVEH